MISNQLILGSLYPAENVATEWAKSADYPLADGDNIALVAQYLSVTYRDTYRAKTEYLQFLKQRYPVRRRAGRVDQRHGARPGTPRARA